MNKIEISTTVSIAEVLGQGICVSQADGQKLFEQVHGILQDGGRVRLSFNGVEHVITAFLNVSIGQLYAGAFTWPDLEARLEYVDLRDGDREKIDMVVLNAKRYFQQKSQARTL